ncbi:MAG: D-glycero-beta-D-manno-heptose 1-phosphate adenylyltransferase [Acidobacteriota bacterium]|nr:D-glycero-beta-D-manno-heptose 1-phosphate adenylyltransferase [Acidobacteriota bacterium]
MMVKFKKLIRRTEVAAFRDGVKREGRTVVFTNGCFDLLHAGHIRLFREARKLGDVLVVGVNADASVRRLKGPNRPVFPLRERLEVLAALTDIGGLISFGEDTPLQLIRRLRPDVLVKGGDWRPEEVVGRAEVEAAGGRLVIVPYLEGRSSSSIIDRVLESAS